MTPEKTRILAGGAFTIGFICGLMLCSMAHLYKARERSHEEIYRHFDHVPEGGCVLHLEPRAYTVEEIGALAATCDYGEPIIVEGANKP